MNNEGRGQHWARKRVESAWRLVHPRDRRILRSFKSGLGIRSVARRFQLKPSEVERIIRNWLFK